ncbi:hypothetical protein SDC9_168764 [bioreactor metagenome]|uniref:SH3b domain-containing protein n=1 Tax=bioreactor metagenome TaxID=1076179 RepID=A0A645G409_9ZZZZ
MRSGPSTSYSILGTIGQGQSVTCVGTTDNWTKILWGSSYGYVYTAYLSSSYYGNWYSGSSWGTDVLWGSSDVYLQSSAPLYSTNNASSVYYVTTLSHGTSVTLVSVESNNWAKILYNGGIYYTPASALAYR